MAFHSFKLFFFSRNLGEDTNMSCYGRGNYKVKGVLDKGTVLGLKPGLNINEIMILY